MIRVTKTEERSRTVVTIDGQLSGECVTLVETCCSQAESNQKPVYVFLRDVTTVDQAGTMLLRRLAAKGIRLLARGVYTSYLVQTSLRTARRHRSRPPIQDTWAPMRRGGHYESFRPTPAKMPAVGPRQELKEAPRPGNNEGGDKQGPIEQPSHPVAHFSRLLRPRIPCLKGGSSIIDKNRHTRIASSVTRSMLGTPTLRMPVARHPPKQVPRIVTKPPRS